MSPHAAFQHSLPAPLLSPAQAVGRHQLWLDDAAGEAHGDAGGVAPIDAPAPPLALRIDLSSLAAVPPSSIRGPLRPRSPHAAWPLASDEPPTLPVRRASLRLG